jgi:hypothetical protein
MLSKKYFLGGGRNFSAPPARPTHAEVRDHTDPQESDHRASYMSYRGLQHEGLLKTNFCEIFWAAQFSTFSTASVKSGGSLILDWRQNGASRRRSH